MEAEGKRKRRLLRTNSWLYVDLSVESLQREDGGRDLRKERGGEEKGKREVGGMERILVCFG